MWPTVPRKWLSCLFWTGHIGNEPCWQQGINDAWWLISVFLQSISSVFLHLISDAFRVDLDQKGEMWKMDMTGVILKWEFRVTTGEKPPHPPLSEHGQKLWTGQNGSCSEQLSEKSADQTLWSQVWYEFLNTESVVNVQPPQKTCLNTHRQLFPFLNSFNSPLPFPHKNSLLLPYKWDTIWVTTWVCAPRIVAPRLQTKGLSSNFTSFSQLKTWRPTNFFFFLVSKYNLIIKVQFL